MLDHATELRRRGLRVTPQRLAVLGGLEDLGGHRAADELAEHARARIGGISRQGVYDALAALGAAGLVRRIELPGAPAYYELRVGDNHHHLVCRVCGRTEDVDCVTGEAPCLEPADLRGFRVDEAEIVFWGVCPDCAGNGAGG